MNGRESSAKKAKKARGNRADEDPSSLVSEEIQAAIDSQVNRNADGEEMTYEDKQDEMVEQLAEKRSSTRMGALARLIDQLQTNVDYDFVSGRFDTLEMYLLASVKKGDASEVTLACRSLSLLAVTLGAEADRMVSGLSGPLSEFLKNSSKNSAGRAAVAETIGFVNFIGSSNDHETIDAMNMLLEQLRSATLPELVATACWESFTLLASTLPTHKLGGEMTQHLPMLIKYLDHESIDVKTAAGECIALLWESKQEIEAEAAEQAEDDELTPLGESAVPTEPASKEVDEDEDDTKMTDVDPAFVLSGDTRSPALAPRKRPFAKPTAAASSSSSGPIDEAALIEKFSALAKDSGRYQSKKVRATQKKNFREFLRTVEDGDVPSDSLKIEKSRHEFSGWSQIIQLDAIRDVIGKGLNTHFVHNETLKEIFDLYIESGDGVDDPNRKAASRAQSKAKERENFESRKKNRQKKTALANSFGADE